MEEVHIRPIPMRNFKQHQSTKNLVGKANKLNDLNRQKLYKNISMLSLKDYERIKLNSHCLTTKEILNEKKIHDFQKTDQLAKAFELKKRIKEYDKLHPKTELSQLDRENIELKNNLIKKLQYGIDQNEDSVKEMNKLILCAKVAAIRDKQLHEKKAINEMLKKKDSKLELLMELERLKKLKEQQDNLKKKKIELREGSMVVIGQIKEKEMERQRIQKEKEEEGKKIVADIIEKKEKEREELERKKIENAKAAKMIEQENIKNADNKKLIKLKEKELDMKILAYNMAKAKKEEEEIAEKKRLAEEKEREVQRLREKQEKAQDFQAEIDGLRAKRAFEENERAIRKQELLELQRKNNMMRELIEQNEKQKNDRKTQLEEQALKDQEEYMYIIKNQLLEMEREKKELEEKKKKIYEHNLDLKRMIKEREERNFVFERAKLQEGKVDRQNETKRLLRLLEYKRKAVEELKNEGINRDYIRDLENFKVY